MIPPLTVIDIKQESKDTNIYKNIPLSFVNNHVVKLSVMTNAFYWHYHPNSDETFLVIEGTLCIDLPDRTVELVPGQLFTVPANVKHRTWPKEGRSVNLTFEIFETDTVRF